MPPPLQAASNSPLPVADFVGAGVRADLTAIALGDPRCAREAGQRLVAAAGWSDAVTLSGRWRIASALYGKLEALGAAGTSVPIDVESRAALRRLSVIASAQTTLVLQRSRVALQAIETAGYEAVAVKGVALIAALYDGRATRMVGDLDIIVREGDFGAVKAALEAAGFADCSPEFERHVSDIGASERLHNYARTFVHDGFEVDTHWRFGPMPPGALATERLIARARRVQLGKTEIAVASPIDAMLIGTHHALRGYFVPRETVKDLADLAAWWTLGRSGWDLDELLGAAREAELATSLCALWRILCSRYPEHPAAEGIAALERSLSTRARAEARHLAQYFDDQLARGDHAERTVQFFALSVAARSVLAKSRASLERRSHNASNAPTYKRRPFAARVTHLIGRMVKVMRELGRLRSFKAYRAVARAQSRYH